MRNALRTWAAKKVSLSRAPNSSAFEHYSAQYSIVSPRKGEEVAERRASEGERSVFPKFEILFPYFINALLRGMDCIVESQRNSAIYFCLANLWHKRSKLESGRRKRKKREIWRGRRERNQNTSRPE